MINEKKLVEEIQKYFVNNSIHKNDLAEVIAKQPKVNEWIPVEERLPEENGPYLCCEDYIGFKYLEVLNFNKNLHEVDEYDFPDEKRPGFYYSDKEYGYVEKTKVIAWQPLPAPYDMRKE